MKLTLLLFAGFLTISGFSNAQTSGNSLHFDGTDDFVTCALPTVFNNIGSNDLTIEMWINQDTSKFSRLFFAQLDIDNFVAISLHSTNEIVFYITENSTSHSVQSSDVIVNTEWTHIAATWDASSMEAKIYINGKEVSYFGGQFFSTTGIDNTMTIGSRTDGDQTFNGEIDEISIWGDVKTECELASELASKIAGDETDLIRYYGCDSGTAGGINTGIITLDAGPFAPLPSNGTLMNFSLIGPTSNWLSSGVNINKAYGASSSVTISGQTLTGEEIFSPFYAWINCSNNTQVVGATSSTFNPTIDDPNYDPSGVSYAMISSDGTCLDTTECVLFNSLSLPDFENENLLVYPNPSNGVLYIESAVEIESIQVISTNGALIKIIEFNGVGKEQIDMSGLNGIYFIKVKTSSSVIVKKISIE